jgi:membrane-associated phospholipid phosphatase
MPASESRAGFARAISTAGLLVSVWARPVVAAEPALAAAPAIEAAAAGDAIELRHTRPTELAIELAVSVAFASSVMLAAGPPASRCAWCAAGAFDEGVRDALRAHHPRTAAALSHAFSSAAAPALALGAIVPPALMRGRGDHALENLVILLDAVLLTHGVTHAAKRVFDRARPAVHHGVVGDTEYDETPSQWNQSFFSGDTSFAFALGSSAATLSFLRGYRSAPWVVFAGSILGVGTACLRIAADMHWATDVLTGAVAGTAIGVSLPYFLHSRAGAEPRAFTLLPLVGRGELGVLTGTTF